MTTATVPAFCFNCNSGARYYAPPDGQSWRDVFMCCKLNAPSMDEHGHGSMARPVMDKGRASA